MRTIFIFLLTIAPLYRLAAQTLTGSVSDQATGAPLEAVVIENLTGGQHAISNAKGHYQLPVHGGDKILFTRLNYGSITIILPPDLPEKYRKDISLTANFVKVPEVIIYSELTKRQKDSLAERALFGKKVDQKPAKFSLDKENGIVFNNPISAPYQRLAKKYKRLRAFQKRYKEAEEQNIVEERYTLQLIADVTQLGGDSLIAFRNQNPLPYDMAVYASDLEVKSWIKLQFKRWIKDPKLLPAEENISWPPVKKQNRR